MILEDVVVRPFAVVAHYKAFERPRSIGVVAQLPHVAIDVGIGATPELIPCTTRNGGVIIPSAIIGSMAFTRRARGV